MDDRRKKLIEDHLSFCYWWLYKHNVTDKDMQQVYILDLCKRVEIYDESRGTFTTFISQVFQSAYKHIITYNYTQKARGDNSTIYLSDILHRDDDGEDDFCVEDSLAYTEQQFSSVETREIYEEILNVIDKVIIKEKPRKYLLSYLECWNYRKVAELYGCSVQNVQQSVTTSFNKIRSYFYKKYGKDAIFI